MSPSTLSTRSIIFCRLNRYLVKISLSVRLSRGLVLSRNSLSLLRLRALRASWSAKRHFVRIYVWLNNTSHPKTTISVVVSCDVFRIVVKELTMHWTHRKFSEIVLTTRRKIRCVTPVRYASYLALRRVVAFREIGPVTDHPIACINCQERAPDMFTVFTVNYQTWKVMRCVRDYCTVYIISGKCCSTVFNEEFKLDSSLVNNHCTEKWLFVEEGTYTFNFH